MNVMVLLLSYVPHMHLFLSHHENTAYKTVMIHFFQIYMYIPRYY